MGERFACTFLCAGGHPEVRLMTRPKATLSRSSPLRTSQTRLEYKVWRKCANCGELFVKRSMAHVACSPGCAVALVAAKKERTAAKALKVERKQDRARKEALKTRSDYLKEAQVAFNTYVRTRDAGKPCICCGESLGSRAVGGSYDCGHYRSVGSAPHLRFHLHNAHAQRKVCNQYGAGRAVDYRIGLIARHGVAMVESLEADNTARKHDIEWLKRFIRIFRKKTRRLEKRRGE
jgi:hypothetical protein